MSLNAKLEQARRDAAWAERKEYGRVDDDLPRWAIDQLLSWGVISADQHTLAKRLDGWNEFSRGGIAAGFGDRVQGGLRDFHSTPRARSEAAFKYSVVMSWIHERMRGQGERRVLWATWGFPHYSVSGLAHVYHYAGGNSDRVVRILQKACGLLEIRMANAAEDILLWGALGSLDKVYGKAEQESQGAGLRA